MEAREIIIPTASIMSCYLLREMAKEDDYFGIEKMALFELQHMLFAIFLASFFHIFIKETMIAWYLCVLSIVGWEIFEEFRWKTASHCPTDTFTDILIGGAFSLLYLLLI